MTKMFIKTIPISLSSNPISWLEDEFSAQIENNIVVGYLLSNQSGMSINLYLLPINSIYNESLLANKLSQAELKTAFLQWLEVLV